MKLFAKKSLGQHFLNSSHVLSQIIEASNIKKGDNILEIGPGTGVLTRALLEKGANVIAIEKDTRAIEPLKDIASSNQNFTIIEGDVLSYTEARPQYSIVANIPYYITGAILEKFLEYGPRPEKMVLLVQKEVAERIVARDGKESVLSISVKAFGTPKIIAKVPRGAFTPPPNVDSAILSIENISGDKFPKGDLGMFFDIVKAGFAHKRKFLKKNLEQVISKEKIDKIWKEVGLDDKIRAENIDVNTWINIFSKTIL